MAVQSILGPGGYSKAPYASFAGKSPAVGGAVVIPFLANLLPENFMAIRNQALTVNFLAWDTNANTGKTGDSANFTLRLIKDGGVAAAPTNAISEPDSTNMPGIYELALTATEMDADFVTLHGISATSNIVIFPLFITTESGDLANIYSDTTIIASDSVVIESSIAVVESQTTVIESDSIIVESSVQAVEAWGDPSSDLAAIESELILVHSETTVVQSDTTAIEAWGNPSTPLSDIESSLVIIKSDIVVIDNAVSDVESSLVIVKSDLVIATSQTTVIESNTEAIHSQTTVIESDSIIVESSVQAVEAWGDPSTPLSDIESSLVIVKSDLVVIESNTVVIESDTTRMELGIITGAAQTGTLSTTQATTNLTGYADDQLIGRVLIVTSGAADGEATDITDYANASGLLTFTALTVAMANGDTFKIV